MTHYAIDLFSGAGGFSEGVHKAGFHILYGNDINEQVKETYMARHAQLGLVQGKNTHFECTDIRELQWEKMKQQVATLSDFQDGVPDIDAIFGGPPCQGFSRAGKREKNDPRNFLFKEYLRLIHEIQPKYVVMENVETFLSTRLDGFVGVFGDNYADDSLITELLSKEFEKIGYRHLEPRVLDASHFGVPQKRRRVIYLAYRQDMQAPTYPEPITKENKPTVKEALAAIPSHLTNQELSNHNVYIQERFSLFLHGESQKQIRTRLAKGFDITKIPNWMDKIHETLFPHVSKEEVIDHCRTNPSEEVLNLILTKKNTRRRLHPNEPSPTVMSQGDDFIHPLENRGLTVREMARLQSFDDDFEFKGKRTTGGLRRRIDVPQMTQVGNAVPPLLSFAVAKEIKNVLTHS